MKSCLHVSRHCIGDERPLLDSMYFYKTSDLDVVLDFLPHALGTGLCWNVR